jgi:hypothetical protein
MHRALSLAAAFRRRLRQITLTRLRRLDDARYFFHFHADDVSVLFRHTPPTLMPMFISSLVWYCFRLRRRCFITPPPPRRHSRLRDAAELSAAAAIFIYASARISCADTPPPLSDSADLRPMMASPRRHFHMPLASFSDAR